MFGATIVTDAVFAFFTAAVASRHCFRAENWSAVWYLLAAVSVISYTSNPIYVVFAALGSWVGALLKVGWENIEHDGVGDLEVESAYGGVKSHADIGLGRVDHLGRLHYEYAIECKTTKWTGEYEGPKGYQILQNAQQALGIGAPRFGVITWQMASSKAPRGQTYFETQDYRGRVDAELKRQRAALKPDMPMGDPQENWRCRLCRSMACDRSPKYMEQVPY